MNMNKDKLIYKKLETAWDIIHSEEFKKADILIKKLNKLKEELKDFCQNAGIKELSIETPQGIKKVEYKVRKQLRPDTKLLDPEILESITEEREVWLGYFEK